MFKKVTNLSRFGLALMLLGAPLFSNADTPKKPNFLLIVADDLGYSDVGAFGGEIETPTLDNLANEGVRLTNFHTAPTCSPTRAMLLSGTDNHQAGLGSMAEALTKEQRGKPGYEGHLNNLVATLPEVLQDHGYSTSIAGKWHLGRTEELSPAARGFEHSYVLLQGGASHYDDATAIIGADPVAIYRENGKQVQLPDGFYSTDFYTDKTIEYIDAAGDKPFFAFLSYTAPHWPFHAPESYISKYEGRYDEGYKTVRENRLARMKELGIIGKQVEANLHFDELPEWEDLTPEQRAREARAMEVYAAMIDSMDDNIARILAHLENTGKIENTVVMFMSDNGADGNSIGDLMHRNQAWIDANFDNSLANMGKKGSYIWQNAQWGQISATPFAMYKGFTSQGGLVVPVILSMPNDASIEGTINSEFFHVMDIMPTFLELAGAELPTSPYKGREIFEVQGESMLPGLAGVETKDRVVGWELFGRAALRKGDWKIRKLEPPYGSGGWELYNLAEDPTETRDLAQTKPAKLAELLASWDDYLATNGVFTAPPEVFRKIGYSFRTCLYGTCVGAAPKEIQKSEN